MKELKINICKAHHVRKLRIAHLKFRLETILLIAEVFSFPELNYNENLNTSQNVNKNN